MLGKLDDALKLHEEDEARRSTALHLYLKTKKTSSRQPERTVYGPESIDLDIAFSLWKLGNMYQRLERLGKVLKMHEQSLE